MGKIQTTQKADAYQLLLHVPKRAIVDRLLESTVSAGSLATAFALKSTDKGVPTRERLFGMAIAKLAEVFAACADTSETDARKLHDEWRYRGMKALYLYRTANTKLAKSALEKRLNDAVEDFSILSFVTDNSSSEGHFRFHGISEFKDGSQDIVEIAYRYAAPLQYVDPEDEDAKVVADLRNGFAWISPGSDWAAIAARDIDTRDNVVACLERACGGTFVGIRFNKEIIAKLENAKRLRRIAFVDPATRTTRRFTGQRLGEDASAQGEILQRSATDEAPFNGFVVQVDSDTEMVLGYNNRQGKIFFSKDLTASQLRSWGPDKISSILNEVSKILRSRPAFKQQVMNEYFVSLPKAARSAAAELAVAVAACKNAGASEHALALKQNDLQTALGNLVVPVLVALREDTEEVADIACPSCTSENVGIASKTLGVRCLDCGYKIGLSSLGMSDGKKLKVKELSEITQLVPTPELLQAVTKAAASIADSPGIGQGEYFYVRDETLFFSAVSGEAELSVDAVPELKANLNGAVPGPRRAAIAAALPLFKEKCRHISTANCARCVGARVGPSCYLRLFGLADSKFTPRPHTGNEYGDYKCAVTIDGIKNRSLVVAMKSMPAGKGEITASSSTGREILQQVIHYMRNPGIHAIGVCVPRGLHGDFRGILLQQAQFHKKKVVFMDENVLSRMISHTMTTRRMKLADF